MTIARPAPASSALDKDDEGDPAPSGDLPEAKADADDDGDDEDNDLDDEFDSAVPATTRAARRVGHAVENTGTAARDASVAAARWSSDTFGKLFAGASAKIAALRARQATPAKRRTTAKPSDAPSPLDGKRLRPQSGKASDSSPPVAMPARKSNKRVAIGIAIAAVAASAGAVALRPSKVASKSASSDAVAAAAPLAADTSLAAPSMTGLGAGVVPLPGATPTAGAQNPAASPPSAPPGSPVTANVPLFGPTPLATMEPAPLGPPPSAETKGVESAEMVAAKAVAPATANDEEFPEPIEHVDGKKGADSKAVDAKNARPEDVPAWGKGKMHAPTVHRLRLDGPGTAIHGVSDATGFTVLVPGRKLMEQGAAIAKRDTRIGRARTTNTPGGAQVRITFRETLPGYRVRLRRDYVEVLISAPEETAKKPDVKKPEAKSTKEAAKPTANAASAKSSAKH